MATKIITEKRFKIGFLMKKLGLSEKELGALLSCTVPPVQDSRVVIEKSLLFKFKKVEE